MPIETRIRKSGGAVILTVPKPVLQYLRAKIGSTVSIEMIDGAMVCRKTSDDSMTLESLIATSPQEHFIMTDEDNEWFGLEPVGAEI